MNFDVFFLRGARRVFREIPLWKLLFRYGKFYVTYSTKQWSRHDQLWPWAYLRVDKLIYLRAETAERLRMYTFVTNGLWSGSQTFLSTVTHIFRAVTLGRIVNFDEPQKSTVKTHTWSL